MTHRSDYMSVFKQLNVMSDDDDEEASRDSPSQREKFKLAQSDIINNVVDLSQSNNHNYYHYDKSKNEDEERKRIQTHEIILT